MIIDAEEITFVKTGKKTETVRTPCQFPMPDVLRWSLCKETRRFIEVHFYNGDYMLIDYDLEKWKVKYAKTRSNGDLIGGAN